LDEQRLGAGGLQLGGQRLAGLAASAGDGDGGALAGGGLGDTGAQPLGPPAAQDGLVGEQCHSCLLVGGGAGRRPAGVGQRRWPVAGQHIGDAAGGGGEGGGRGSGGAGPTGGGGGALGWRGG